MEISNLNDFVMIHSDKLMADSRIVAKHFKRRHSNVLRDVYNLECSDKFKASNFEFIYETMTYVDSSGAEIRKTTSRVGAINMTKDGFMLLVMGYTGKAAMLIKEAYIGAFNAMAEHIKTIKTLEQRVHDLEIREIDSKISATFGSYLMLTRKKEKKLIERERLEIENQMQYRLFNDPPAEAGFLH